MPLSIRHSICLALLALSVAACSRPDKEKPFVARDVDTLYNMGADMLDKKQYRSSAAIFDEVERQHPYSTWARRAQLMSAYANYMANKYDESILSAQRFLSLHPGNKDAPFAYYLIAVCYYEQISDVRRDQKVTQQALTALTELVRRYPNSEYAADARLKMDLTFDHLAGKEMEIGRFYQNRGQFLAAISRFRAVVEKYNTTSHVPEALHRLVESYLALGVKVEAQKAAAVLGYNYPGSKWYERSYDLVSRDAS